MFHQSICNLKIEMNINLFREKFIIFLTFNLKNGERVGNKSFTIALYYKNVIIQMESEH